MESISSRLDQAGEGMSGMEDMADEVKHSNISKNKCRHEHPRKNKPRNPQARKRR